MKIERVKLRGFRCFGNGGSDLTLEKGITTFVGSNGAGKTATLQALSRIFGISAYERTIKKSDFHLAEQQELASGSELSIDVLLGFPELDDEEEEEDNENQDDEDVDDDEDPGDSVPEFFQQMAASAPNGPLKVRIVLRARWVDGGENYGELIYAEFNNPGIAHECHLSGGDSGGGVFVLEDGLWRLAGINLSVDGPFRKSASDPVFSATLYDMGGLELKVGDVWKPITEEEEGIPSRFYSSHIAASLDWLEANVPGTSSIAPECFAAWRKWYFSPAQTADEMISSPTADPDGDGIANLMEYALNLDPLFAEPHAMSPGTGLRGLPAVRVENISGNDRLTIEFVRRVTGSGSDIIYTPQFSSGLGTWQTGGDETVTPINARWERVKVVDTVNVDEQTRRFARLKVALREGCMISARALQERRPAGALARFPAWSDGKTPVGGHRARTG